MTRFFNFSAGPSMIPKEVLYRASKDIISWKNSGVGIMEMSHRSKEFIGICEEALYDLRCLLKIPSCYKIIFLQGGGRSENSIVPMNLMGKNKFVDVVVTGYWSKKSYNEAKKYGTVRLTNGIEYVNGLSNIKDFYKWNISNKSAYLHICMNETIDGIEMFDIINSCVPLVVDASSNILSRFIDINKVGVLFAAAQKNIGISGLTIVIVRDDLLDQYMNICPSTFIWKKVVINNSMYNTPPVYAIYIAGLMFKWIINRGGLKKIEEENIKKSNLLYNAIDNSDYYINKVSKNFRSRMNVPFFISDNSRIEDFLNGAKEWRLLNLRGHQSIGGIRASIYNSMPIEGIRILVDYMKYFEKYNS